jgi:tripartite-type tricarboxylate transporter receptor subunit TctC
MKRWITLPALAVSGALAVIGAIGCSGAYAQGFPNRPIRIIVHVPPGGAPDITARVIADRIAPGLGQPVVVENRTGSNGNIAGEIVVRSPADGHTLLLCADSQIVINPHVYAKMTFDTMKDLVPVASVASNEFFLAANPGQPFRTLREFIEYAKNANPPLAYASGGNGSQHHLTMEMLKARAGIKLLHVPFKGAGPATTAVIAGDVPVLFAGANAGPQIRAGKLRALAIAGAKRLAAFPDVPTIAELFPGFVNSVWLGLCAPRGTPEAVIARLRTEVNHVLALPETKEIFARSGALEPYISTPEEFAALIRADYEKYGRVVRAVGVKVD